MFRYDKDRERVMQAKKREVVAELEAQKQDAIKEMYDVLEIIMGKMQGLLADYNHIKLTIDKRFEEVLKGSEDAIEETNEKVNEHLIRFENEANEKFANVDNTLNEKIISFTSTINSKIGELETLQATVTELKTQCENLLNGAVTEEDLAELEARVTELMESAGVQGDWNETNESSKAFIKNRTHYYDIIADKLNKTSNLNLTATNGMVKMYHGSVQFSESCTLKAGNEIRVEWNGTIYDLNLRTVNGFTAGGNGNYYLQYGGSPYDTYGSNYPFFVLITSSYAEFYTDVNGSATANIYALTSGLKKLDEMFMPNTVIMVAHDTDDDGKTVIISSGKPRLENPCATEYKVFNCFQETGVLNGGTPFMNEMLKTNYPSEGDNVTVYIDNEEYESPCLKCAINDTLVTAIGNPSILNGTVNGEVYDNGLPFLFYKYGTQSISCHHESLDMFTFRIGTSETIIKKLDEKFLPEVISKLTLKSLNGNLFNLTVSDNGELSIEAVTE